MLYYAEFNTGRKCMQQVKSYSSGKLSVILKDCSHKKWYSLIETYVYLDFVRRFIYFENSRVRPKCTVSCGIILSSKLILCLKKAKVINIEFFLPW